MARFSDRIRCWSPAAWLAAALAAITTLARANEQTANAPHFSLPPKALYAAASAAAFPDGSGVALLEIQESYRFAADGSDTYVQYMVYKVLSPAGAERWNELSIDWAPWRDTRPELRARVISPDGKTYTLDPATIADSPALESDSAVYSDERTLRAPLPAIAPGAVVETEIVMNEGPLLQGVGRIGRSVFEDPDPVQHFRLTLQAPKSLPLRYRIDLMPGVQPVRSETADGVQWVFDAGPMPAAKDADPGLPGDVYSQPTITFSTGESWHELAQKYTQLVDKRIAVDAGPMPAATADVRDLVGRLVKGRRTAAEKASAIVEFLNREVRYTGIEFDQSSIIPHSPAETLGHKYGDCKDKSTLLVAMLRAAGVRANLALLNAGDRLDVPGDLPGMGLFDHVIVHVPGDPELWIDATDDDARLGQLPDGDRGRLALIVASDTTALTRIAEARSVDNLDLEEREIYLADSGAARVVETLQPQGAYESLYRGLYADFTGRQTKENLADYAKHDADVDSLEDLVRSDPKDFSRPFRLRFEGKRPKYGETTLTEAAAYINIDGLFSGLPAELKTRQATDEEHGATAKAKSERANDYLLERPYVAEWRYKIVPPAGFDPVALPTDIQMSLGPSALEEHFSATPDGVAHVVMRFDTVKRRFTPEEQAALRIKVADLTSEGLIKIKFELRAHVLLAQGHARESFQAYRDLVAAHPQEAIQHLRRAGALLEAGMGEAARAEATLAVQLDPSSAFAQKTLAFVLQHDLIGRWHQTGSDFAGARAAYRAAIALDPKDKSLVAEYAVLLEHGEHGIRYGPGADLEGALAAYQQLTARQLANFGVARNPAFDLFYTRQFASARDNAAAMKGPPVNLITACVAELEGVKQAMDEARRRTDGDANYRQTLASAGRLLLNLREYSNAAQLLEVGAWGNNVADTMGLAATLRNTRRHEDLQFADKPDDVLLHFVLDMMTGTLTPETLTAMESHNALLTHDHDPANYKLAVQRWSPSRIRTRALRSNMAPDAMVDISFQTIKVRGSGTDNTGYREILQAPGQPNQEFFLVRENGQYRFLDTSERPYALALEVLERLAHGNMQGAALLLDWARDSVTNPADDDPYAGSLLPHFWSQERPSVDANRGVDAHRIALAAASLLVLSPHTAQRGVTILEEARKNGPASDYEAESIDLALLRGYTQLKNYEGALAAAETLTQRSPRSRVVFEEESASLRALKRFKEAEGLARKRLESNPDDIPALRSLYGTAALLHQYPAAYEQALKIVANGHSTARDLNEAAWLSLFFERAGGPDIDSAVRAAQLANNDGNILQTLGSLYAEAGKTKEAREVLLQSLDARGLDEPDASYWYAFGRIAEEYGERDIALADYAKITPPPDATVEALSTFRLAQHRMQLLGAIHSTPERQANTAAHPAG